MKQLLTLIAGVIFGIGLTLSGMTDPARVRGFLDIFGDWDPTLAFVMGGALIVMAVAWFIQPKMVKPLVDTTWHLPGTRHIDGKLVGGAALFGVGWGLGGLCPGPAIASLGTAPSPAAIATFVASMLAGMLLHKLVTSKNA
ncbi:YeeE/YedE family protein [Alteraurantiacibacter aquimixticola]|uniref:YeeE/YedE family protein n=1 Tax=Alteraurantiacibacter aquimixticola TaxID=2489173 RepID=A0A4T3EYI9_9SPHN|nr:YeeE/YedE family protein [Alteraurantiacibacter aquimixticola]TIX49676.1 YeeE/YedE family protein [Alteraurantiacibacter aquimixticola]